MTIQVNILELQLAIFPGTKANNMTDDTSTTRDVFAPAEIKRKVILAVTPTAPTVEVKRMVV